MILNLVRTWKTAKSTIGLLYAYLDNDMENSIFRFYTLEDVERAVKIKGQTAIPTGSYEIVWDWSKKFQKQVLMLKDVHNFDRIYIHAGVKAEDTEGCILCGLIRKDDLIVMSAPAVSAVYHEVGEALKKGEKVIINIK